MEGELMLGDIYEELAEKLAQARTKALMGEREEALGIFHGASLQFTRFRDVLSGYPGHHALEHAFEVTMQALCEEQEHLIEAGRIAETEPLARGGRPKRRSRRAA